MARTAPIYEIASGEPTVATRHLAIGEEMPEGFGFTREAMCFGWPSLCTYCDALTDPDTDECVHHGPQRARGGDDA